MGNYERHTAFIPLLVLANVAVFALQAYMWDQALMDQYVLSAQQVLEQGRYEALFTSAFMHGNLVHLGMNMVFLYLLGRLCEDAFGTAATAVIYTAGIVLGGLSFIYLFPEEQAVGASAAVFGLAGAAMLGAPEKSLLDEAPVLHWLALPLVRNLFSAIFISTVFLALPNIMNAFNLESGVAHIAHIGGLAAGVVIALLVRPHKAKKGIIVALVFAGFVAAIVFAPNEEFQLYAAAGMIGAALLVRVLLAVV